MALAAVIIIGFFAYRGARLIAHDKIGEPIRKRAYATQATHGRIGRWINALVTCPYCLGEYASLLGVVLWIWLVLPGWPGFGVFFLTWQAAAGTQAILAATDLALTAYVEKVH